MEKLGLQRRSQPSCIVPGGIDGGAYRYTSFRPTLKGARAASAAMSMCFVFPAESSSALSFTNLLMQYERFAVIIARSYTLQWSSVLTEVVQILGIPAEACAPQSKATLQIRPHPIHLPTKTS